VATLGVGIAMRDVEAILFAVLVFAGLLLLPFRKGLLGRTVLVLVFLDTAGWMVPAAVSNVRHHDELIYVAVPVVLGAIAVSGVLAAVGSGTWVVPVILALVAAASVGYSQIRTGDDVRGRGSDLSVSAKTVKFTPKRLSADNGELSVRVTNHDLFWHTLTIDGLNVDLRIPVGATRRVTFDAPAGAYEFYCRIPGHKQAGMKGTLVVS
jgi:plastocyanin